MYQTSFWKWKLRQIEGPCTFRSFINFLTIEKRKWKKSLFRFVLEWYKTKRPSVFRYCFYHVKTKIEKQFVFRCSFWVRGCFVHLIFMDGWKLKMAINFDFSFSFSRKIYLGSSILMKPKTQTQIKEHVSLILKKAKSKIEIIFSKSDFNFHVNFGNLVWRATVTAVQQWQTLYSGRDSNGTNVLQYVKTYRDRWRSTQSCWELFPL